LRSLAAIKRLLKDTKQETQTQGRDPSNKLSEPNQSEINKTESTLEETPKAESEDTSGAQL
ncbi:MAG: heme biosynthesis operon protein HemX, partial [Psychromonas sp.]|nr:heme biosynthesis operon protein HemX [Psychromonas sp.]